MGHQVISLNPKALNPLLTTSSGPSLNTNTLTPTSDTVRPAVPHFLQVRGFRVQGLRRFGVLGRFGGFRGSRRFWGLGILEFCVWRFGGLGV